MAHERALAQEARDHERVLAEESRIRDWEHQAIVDVMAALNYFSRAAGAEAASYDVRFVVFADAMNRADLVVIDPEARASLHRLNTKVRAAHHYRNQRDSSDIGDEWWNLLDIAWGEHEPLAIAMRARFAGSRNGK
jgi:hypothetical protein